MSRLKLKQLLSNIQYNSSIDQLTISGSGSPSFIISGSVEITSTPSLTGSLSINGINTFGDSGSFDTVDLGDF